MQEKLRNGINPVPCKGAGKFQIMPGIAEGRINDGHKMRKCFDAGAFAVVIGTSISEPAKIVKTILNDSKE